MLWVQVATHYLPGPVVLRHRYRRRLQAAIQDALRDAGLDANAILWAGRRVGAKQRLKNSTDDDVGKGITGTLQVTAQKDMVKAQWKEVKEQIGLIAAKLKNHLKAGKVGLSTKKPGQRWVRDD